jgi:hypothetical protein
MAGYLNAVQHLACLQIAYFKSEQFVYVYESIVSDCH